MAFAKRQGGRAGGETSSATAAEWRELNAACDGVSIEG